ncbi:hypothetical protein MANES_14G089351v8 [Manihot esculenta]|uniref:Uncharacterized protein n=1 Tax=Manihot esculenta TaxID=3983 RepID=A0ACB7GFI7_MANES|nr:hypothetical protein MANES_14G089351v8 [Manihot esculenta]
MEELLHGHSLISTYYKISHNPLRLGKIWCFLIVPLMVVTFPGHPPTLGSASQAQSVGVVAASQFFTPPPLPHLSCGGWPPNPPQFPLILFSFSRKSNNCISAYLHQIRLSDLPSIPISLFFFLFWIAKKNKMIKFVEIHIWIGIELTVPDYPEKFVS